MKKITEALIMISLFMFFFFNLFTNAYALEKDYQIPWCKSHGGFYSGAPVTVRDPFTGKVEGYVDCITATHAIEVDFTCKWKEAPTQAMWYAMNTGKRAGILLIKTDKCPTGEKKLMDYINHYNLPIDVWTVNE